MNDLWSRDNYIKKLDRIADKAKESKANNSEQDLRDFGPKQWAPHVPDFGSGGTIYQTGKINDPNIVDDDVIKDVEPRFISKIIKDFESLAEDQLSLNRNLVSLCNDNCETLEEEVDENEYSYIAIPFEEYLKKYYNDRTAIRSLSKLSALSGYLNYVETKNKAILELIRNYL